MPEGKRRRLKTNTMSEFLNEKEFIDVKRYFREDELDEMRLDHTNKLIRLDVISEEIKALQDKYKDEIKALRESATGIRKEIRQKFTIENKECTLVPDFIEGVMNYTDDTTGEIVMSRKLLPHERQMKINQKIA